MRVEETGGRTGQVTLFSNDLSKNQMAVVNAGQTMVQASVNWWGSNVASILAGEVSGLVSYNPWFDTGTNLAPAGQGFQGDLSLLDAPSQNNVEGDLVSLSVQVPDASAYGAVMPMGLDPRPQHGPDLRHHRPPCRW